ncbi:MAG: 3-deoxy-7-phosphoheptulonate synthase [Gammaproteobacteria bacterium]|nr:3-deoxy-7-phosphoheptulonate synthase [Gammaproteobacteria bacterium]
MDIMDIQDTHIASIRPLISPAWLLERLPLPASSRHFLEQSRQEISAILDKTNDRLLVVVGPCSIHHHHQALEYAQRLQEVRQLWQQDLCIIMRCYFEKPRTTLGWKGYINDPNIDGSCAINEGLEKARTLLLAILEHQVPIATEYLDLQTPQYISDLISWCAIGARTVESPIHRQLVSGLSCPVGLKNTTHGDVTIAAQAVLSAQSSHSFIGLTPWGTAAIYTTRGNPHTHIVLRGGKTPNYSATSIAQAETILANLNLPPRLMIDASHGNSQKKHLQQITVTHDLAQQITQGNKNIIGIMLESHLHEGQQEPKPIHELLHGISITDACLSWEQTFPLFEILAKAVQARRKE